jgi:hypothetical protein
LTWSLAAVAIVLIAQAPAAAQSASRPGPWVLDVRGVTSPVPRDPVFHPALDPSTLVPARGFGVDVGAHVYLFDIGHARLGLGAGMVNLRARTTPPEQPESAGGDPTPAATGQPLQLDLRTITPQVSFNFGAREGWSYLSLGAGVTRIVSTTSGEQSGRRESTRIRNVNMGGGARWFLKSHVAFTFDVRLHRLSSGTAGVPEGTGSVDPEAAAGEPTPGQMLLTVGAGLSFR